MELRNVVDECATLRPDDIPALAAGVSVAGERATAVRGRVVVGPDSPSRVASLTKVFTSTAPAARPGRAGTDGPPEQARCRRGAARP